MDINNVKSELRMEDFYFVEASIKRKKDISKGEYTADLQSEIKNIADHQYRVILTLRIEKEELKICVVASADFTNLSSELEYELEKKVIRVNTVAIMFPFIRSQVTLLTSQPGMTPIVLPAINTAKFAEKENI